MVVSYAQKALHHYQKALHPAHKQQACTGDVSYRRDKHDSKASEQTYLQGYSTNKPGATTQPS